MIGRKSVCFLLSVSLVFFVPVSIGAYVFEYKNASSDNLLSNDAMRHCFLGGKKILLLYTGIGIKGGTRSYKINLYEYLIKDGFEVVFFLVNNSDVQIELDERRLPYYLCTTTTKHSSSLYGSEIVECLHKICNQEPICIINANRELEVRWAQRVAQQHPVKIVLTLHVDNLHTKKWLQGIDWVFCVSPHIAKLVAEQNKRNHLNIKIIDWGAPFFDAKKFLEYEPQKSREEFFYENFGIVLTNAPVLCMVGNFLSAQWKDHPTLLKAIALLKHKRGILLQLLLVGDGPLRKDMQAIAKKLGIEAEVSFLGYTQCVPDVLHYSDISVVASKNEAFCIALLESALLKKPLIGTQSTGMENVIKNNVTGLLFKKGSFIDLADKIELLIKNLPLQKKLGENAYNYVGTHFLPQISIKKIENFYCTVMGTIKNNRKK